MKRLTALAAIMTLAATGAQATILQNWQYNDEAGINAKLATNTAGTLTFNTGTRMFVNGTGQAVYTFDGSGGPFSADFLTPITSGTVYYRIDFSSWSFASNSTTAASLGVGFVNSAARTTSATLSKPKANPQIIRTPTTDNSLTGSFVYKYPANPGIAIANPDTPMSLILAVDLDDGANGSYGLWRKIGSATDYTQVVATTQFTNDFTDVKSLRLFIANATIGDQVAVDMMVVGDSLTELQNYGNTPPADTPQSLYADWVSSFTTLTNTTDNPDGDEYNNLAEYALGGNPTNAVDNGYEPMFSMVTLSGTNWMQYVHAQYTDAAARGLTYSVEHSENLVSSGSWTNTAIIAVGSGALDAGFNVYTNRADASGQPQRFLKLKIESSF